MSLKFALLIFLIPTVLFAASPQPIASPGWKLPTAEFRDKMLGKAGLSSKVGDWGAQEKDQLYSTARDSTLADLEKKYPSLPKKHLATLSRLAKAGAKNKGLHVEGQPKADPDDVLNKVIHLNP